MKMFWKMICFLAVILGFVGIQLYAAKQKPCGNSNSYIDMLCKRKQGVLEVETQTPNGSKMPSTPLVPDFEIEPFAGEGKSKVSPFK